METQNKTFALDHNQAVFTIEEELIFDITGQNMLDMGWEIENDSPEDEYEIRISEEGKIKALILCDNGEYSDSEFSFDFIDTIQDLMRHGYLAILDEKGNDTDDGSLQIKD